MSEPESCGMTAAVQGAALAFQGLAEAMAHAACTFGPTCEQEEFERARENLTAIYHARIAAGAIWPWLERVEAWPRLQP